MSGVDPDDVEVLAQPSKYVVPRLPELVPLGWDESENSDLRENGGAHSVPRHLWGDREGSMLRASSGSPIGIP